MSPAQEVCGARFGGPRILRAGRRRASARPVTPLPNAQPLKHARRQPSEAHELCGSSAAAASAQVPSDRGAPQQAHAPQERPERFADRPRSSWAS